jgi:hypothetical protein
MKQVVLISSRWAESIRFAVELEEMPKAESLYRRMYESLALKDIGFQVIL